MNDLRSMLLGAALVALGVLTAALADRIRGARAVRSTEARNGNARVLREATPSQAAPKGPPRTDADLALDRDAIAMLAQSGYTKKEAARAVAAASGSERATLESLVRASLKRLFVSDKVSA